MRILIADDMPKVRTALQLLLSQQPTLTVVGEITNPHDLLDRTQVLQPDILLLDWELAGFSTCELLPQLRRLCTQLYIVALSSQPEARDASLSAGVDAFISKGDAPEYVLDTLLTIALPK
jgi:DNA-binding NarL/FixJ family response regulator